MEQHGTTLAALSCNRSRIRCRSRIERAGGAADRAVNPGDVLLRGMRGRSAQGASLRFVVTNLRQTDRYLYTRMYCARRDMENRI